MKRGARRTLFVLVLVGLLTSGLGCGSGGDSDGAAPRSEPAVRQITEPMAPAPEAQLELPPPRGRPLEPLPDPGPPTVDHDAARVLLHRFAESADRVVGRVKVADEMNARLVGWPKIEVTSASPETLGGLHVEQVTRTAEGFSFRARWPEGSADGLESGHLTARVTLEISCGTTAPTAGLEQAEPLPAIGECKENWCARSGKIKRARPVITPEEGVELGLAEICQGVPAGGTRFVVADTLIELCRDSCGRPAWVSSGDACYACAARKKTGKKPGQKLPETYLCEMAPSPILPAAGDDGLALSGAMLASIAEVARLDGAVVLLAEHTGGCGPVDYEWRVSGGALSDPIQGGVVWELPTGSGQHLIQLALRTPHAAAVVSRRVTV